MGPHEIAYLWWGHTVVRRDCWKQWMSSSFAGCSAAMHAEVVKGPKDLASHMEKLRL
ncbi:MAG: hypothetical protein ACPL7M_08220 [Bryobacteraceae bacterium]